MGTLQRGMKGSARNWVFPVEGRTINFLDSTTWPRLWTAAIEEAGYEVGGACVVEMTTHFHHQENQHFDEKQRRVVMIKVDAHTRHCVLKVIPGKMVDAQEVETDVYREGALWEWSG